MNGSHFHTRQPHAASPTAPCQTQGPPAWDCPKERGWGAASREAFEAQRGPDGALLIGAAEEVAEKIVRHSEALGGISRITFQMNASSLPHAKLMQAIEAVARDVAPLVRRETVVTGGT